MTRLILMLGVFLLAASPGSAVEPGDAATLRNLKTVLWPRAYSQPDPALLETILAPEFQMIDDSGVVSTRAEELAYVRGKTPDPPERRFRFVIERLEVFEGRSAVVTGMGHITDPRSGPGEVRYRSTNVLVKRDGRWQAVASHVSTLR
jgi:hypothetical protein